MLRYFIATILLLAAGYPHAEHSPLQISNTQLVPITNSKTQRQHQLIVMLPSSFDEAKQKNYPVFYFTDGYWDAGLMSGIYGNLHYDNLVPELIMVGFSYPGDSPDYGQLRSFDLTPPLAEGQQKNNGGAKQFLNFIQRDVIPMMENRFRASKRERVLGGSSLGGLFALYAMYEAPNLFKRVIAISPAAGYGNDFLTKRDQAYFAKHPSLQARLYVSLGGDEYRPFRQSIAGLQTHLQQHANKGLVLKTAAIEGGRHASVKPEAYNRGLQWVLQDIKPEGPSGLEKALKGL